MAGQRRTSRSVWEDQAAEYNPDAPSVQRAIRSETWKRRTIGLLAFVAVPLCMVSAMASFSASSRRATPLDPAAISVATNETPGKAVAYTSLLEWIGKTPSPLPDAVVLSWDGYEREDAPLPAEGKKPVGYRFESHRFTLLRSGITYQATVLVAVGDDGSATASSTPSIVQLPELKSATTVDTWFGLTTTTVAGPVREAVSSWADAYASGDPDALRRAIQDTKTGRSYMPLTGVVDVVSVNILAAAFDPEALGNAKQPGRVVVRVEVVLDWGSTDKPSTSPVTYDVLVEAAQSATPYVVAWGGAGSGSMLEPYENAIENATLKLPESRTPAPSSTPSSDEEAED